MQRNIYYVFIIFMLIAPLHFIDTAIFDAEKLLQLHNKYRGYHGLYGLVWDRMASDSATEIAINMCLDKEYVVDSFYGINTYEYKKEDEESTVEVDAETVFNEWFVGGKLYNYKIEPKNKDKTKGFTQIIWQDTNMIGLGVVDGERKVCIVALYFPKGNIHKKYLGNVVKPLTTYSSPYTL